MLPCGPEARGRLTKSCVLAGVTIFGCALTPLIYVFGRRLRSFVFRHIKFEGEGTAAH